jgi:UDP-2,3-diacylglucosamine pyrophosphatase LpxH
MHNVRPASQVMEWLEQRLTLEHRAQVRQALDVAVSTVLKSLLDVELVHGFRSDNRKWDLLLAALSRRRLRRLSHGALDFLRADNVLPYVLRQSMLHSSRTEGYVRAAAQEPALADRDIRYVVYGHTHTPTQTPLGRPAGRSAMYINTGTWRQTIFRSAEHAGSGEFVKIKQMTYAAFYRADEDIDGKAPGTVSYDLWTTSKRKEYVAVPAYGKIRA